MIDQATVNKIIDAATITDVVSEVVTLRRRGVNLIGLCPFHPDKTPSFYVSPAKNICKCFSCGEGGDPVHFVMKHEQLSFYDALRFLAKKYHIDVEERQLTDEEMLAQGDRESMFILNSWAQKHFTSRLFEHEEGRNIGLSYFNERGFREETVRKFQLGYSLEKRNDLYQEALKSGYQRNFLEKTGLVAFYENETAGSDRFRGRVIFPVHTISGKVVAFGGRILKKNDKTAKYVNSPESEIYHKSHELYGIYFAREAIRKENKCYLVEGYTDVISMHQVGVENVVASCGTALTQGQIHLIHRLTNNISILYDGDSAGIKAALRGIDLFLEAGMNVKVLLLPDGEDPDSYARKNSSFAFTLYIQQHETDFIRFKTQLLLDEAGDDPIKRATLVSDIIRSIAVIPDNIIRAEYIRVCSRQMEVTEQVLLDALNKARGNRQKPLPPKPDAFVAAGRPDDVPLPPDVAPPVVSRKEVFPYKAYEEILLRYIVHHGEHVLFDGADDGEYSGVRVAEYIQMELQDDGLTFSVPFYKNMLNEAVAHSREPDFTATRYFLAHPDPEISRETIRLMDDRFPPFRFDAEDGKALKQKEVFEQALRRDLFALKEAYVRQQIRDVKNKIKGLQAEGKIDEALELMREQTRLNEIKMLLSKELGERIVLN
ncbi:MAG: DNA primase [Tannerella sp.]|jgi:DNA primase|nr:DNA primase [Tannerella sp.]